MSQSVNELLTILMTPPPVFIEQRALDILRERYGLEGKLMVLGSERDQNFLLTTPGGEKHLLKFANTSEDPGVTNFQTSAFLHVEKVDPELTVSRVLPTLNGEVEFTVTADNGEDCIVRLFSWIEGVTMISLPKQDRPDNAKEMGGWLARMTTALQDFTHPVMDHELLYDVRHVENLAPLIENVDDPYLCTFINEQMAVFMSTVKPALDKMPRQVVFNDMSPRNYIVDPENPSVLRGFIDFGDMIYTPRIIDIAVACVYWVDDSDDPLANVALFLNGYNKHQPLTAEELAVLQDVMLCRTMIQVLIYHWRARMFHENKEYIMQNLPQVRKTIENLSALDRQVTLQKFQHACG